MNILLHILVFLAAAICSAYLATPLASRVAMRVNAIDQPGDLKVHALAVPRFGGFGILLTVLAIVLVLPLLGQRFGGETAIIGIGALLVALLGFRDDTIGLPQTFKFIVEGLIVIGLAFFWPGGLVWWLAVLFCIWLIALANGYNFIDGLDGLAGGLISINLLALAALFLLSGDPPSALLSLACAGACLGFLRHNWQPASIFLGDGGALGLGFLIGGLSFAYVRAGDYSFNRIIAVLLAAAPAVAEVAFTLVRRLAVRRSLLPWELFAGDRFHFYDQMRVNAGLSVRSTVLASYGAAMVLACLGVIAHLLPALGAVVTGLVGLAFLILCAIWFKIGIPHAEGSNS